MFVQTLLLGMMIIGTRRWRVAATLLVWIVGVWSLLLYSNGSATILMPRLCVFFIRYGWNWIRLLIDLVCVLLSCIQICVLTGSEVLFGCIIQTELEFTPTCATCLVLKLLWFLLVNVSGILDNVLLRWKRLIVRSCAHRRLLLMVGCPSEYRLHGIACARLLNRGCILADMADILIQIGRIWAFMVLATAHVGCLVALARTLIVVLQLPLVFLLTADVLSGIRHTQVVLVHRVYFLQASQRVTRRLLLILLISGVRGANSVTSIVIIGAPGQTIDWVGGEGQAIATATAERDHWPHKVSGWYTLVIR